MLLLYLFYLLPLLAYKLGIAFCDHNHERKHALAGYDGVVNFTKEINMSINSPVWQALNRPCPGSEGESQEGAWRQGETLPHDKGRKRFPPCVRHILQSNRAIDTTVWKRDMEFVTGEFEVFGRVSSESRLAYGRQEAKEASRRYVDVPKLGGCP